MVFMPFIEGQRYETESNCVCEITDLDRANQTLTVKWINTLLGSLTWSFEEFRGRNWKLLPQYAPPLVELKKGQTWRRKADNKLITLGERSTDFGPHPDAGFLIKHEFGGFTANDFRNYFTFVSDAPETSCPASKTGNPIDCGGCQEHVKALLPVDLYWVQEKSGPKCPNGGCYTPFQNVAMHYSPRLDDDGNKIGVDLEWSCEPCRLLDEEEWADRTGYVGTTNVLTNKKIPERIDRRLSHAAGMHDDDLIG